MAKKFSIFSEIAAIDKTRQVFRQVARNMAPIAKAARGLSRGFGAVSVAARGFGRNLRNVGLIGAALVAGGAFAFKRQMIDTAAEFERYGAILETIEGSSAKAAKSMDWISDFAATTPFAIGEVTDNFVKLRAFGLDPTTGLLKTLGDTAAAMGKDVGQAVEAISDAVTGENERLKEFGIKARTEGNRILYEYTQNGKTMVAAAERGNREMIQAVLTGIWNEKYGGAMDKMSGTWDGMVSNLGDQWSRFKLMIMDSGPFQFLKDELSGLLDKINAMAASGELRAFAEQIGQGILDTFRAVKSAAIDFTAAFQAVMPVIRDAVEWMGGWKNVALGAAAVIGTTLVAAVAAFTVALVANPIGLIVMGVAALAAGIAALVANWDEWKDSIATWVPMGWLLVGVVEAIRNNWDGIVAVLGDVWSAMQPVIDGMAGIAKFALNPVGGIMDAVGGLFGDGAPAAAAPTLAGRAGGLVDGGGRQRGEMTVRFENMPRGARVETGRTDNMDIETDTGFSMVGGPAA